MAIFKRKVEDDDINVTSVTKLYEAFDKDEKLTAYVLHKVGLKNKYRRDKKIIPLDETYFDEIIYFYNKLKDKEIYKNFIDEYLIDTTKNIVFKHESLNKLLSIFADKKIIINIMNFLNENVVPVDRSTSTIDLLIDHLVEIRQYYVDERSLQSSLMALVTSALERYGKLNQKDVACDSDGFPIFWHRYYEFADILLELMEKNKNEAKKMCGIYPVDWDNMMNIDRQLDILGLKREKLSELIKTADNQIEVLRDTIKQGNKLLSDSPNILLPEKFNKSINYFFDESISFKRRFEKLMELKERDIYYNNAVYHEKFDDILTMILENQTPYIYGPSGCGKTYMIERQIAGLLGQNITTNGYILNEQDILGYVSQSNGNYVPSNLYRCYKLGDIIFFDELDSSIGNATVVLNKFIGGKDENYVFPNGEELKRHPNFRIVSSGNTDGSGETIIRQKIDESLMQKLTPIEINYDSKIEKRILIDYPGWYNFGTYFRKAAESINNNSQETVNNISVFTTKDASNIKNYLKNKSFTDDQILSYEIIGTKSEDYLNMIYKNMEGYNNNGEITKEGQKILKLYKKLIDKK